MNKKVNLPLAVALLIIMTGVSGMAIWWYSAKLKESVPAAQQAGQVSNFKPAVTAEQPPTDNQSTAAASNEAEPLQNHSDSSTIEYINNEFGFKLNLPANWGKEYKAITFKDETLPAVGGQEFTSVQILLPTTEPNWEGAGNGTDTIVKGYAAVLDVDIFDINVWNELVNSADCKKNPNCPYLDGMLAKTDKYIYFASRLNDLPDDLQQMFSSSWPTFDPATYVEQNFTLINNS